jgi:catechol 2,3-dioxygenase-like lactoylglutathione lyase family enzyme
MSVITVDSVIYGVTDFVAAKRFWKDFGLSLVDESADRLRFTAIDGSTIEVRPADDPTLPDAIEPGSTVRESIFGVGSKDDLDAIASELANDRDLHIDDDGTVHTRDPLGIAIGFRVSRCRKVTAPDPQFNMPGRVGRLNARAKFYKSAQPMELTHVVYMVTDTAAEIDFYVGRLGFRISDCYPGKGYFLRGGASNNHHNLFLLNPGGKSDKLGFHHVAFEVANVHELFGGGLNMTRLGWKTMLGPGRHPISSCYFWYFLNPCGGGAEYDFDSDIVDDDWVGEEFEQTPDVFAEWSLAAGMEETLLYRGVQTGDTIKASGGGGG